MDPHERDRLFGEAFRARRGLVVATVRKTVWYATPADVEDIVQEVTIVAWRAFDPSRPETFAPWLVTTSRRCALNHLRKLNARAALMKRFADEFKDDVDEGPGAALEPSGPHDTVLAALEGLKPPIRAVVMLHAEGRSLRKIADILGIHRETAGTRLRHGLKRLRRLLGTHA